MRKRIHDVVLTSEEKSRLESIAYGGTHRVRQVVTARVLLKASCGVLDREVAESLDVAHSTVAALRKRCAKFGIESCLNRREQKNRARKITGDVEARIVHIACGPVPAGCARWTLDLIAERIVELQILPSIGRSAVGEVLKKTRSNPGSTSASAYRPRRAESS